MNYLISSFLEKAENITTTEELHLILEEIDLQLLNILNPQSDVFCTSNYYKQKGGEMECTKLNRKLMAFWDVYKEFHNDEFSGYIIVKLCEYVKYFNSTLNSGASNPEICLKNLDHFNIFQPDIASGL